MSKKRKILIVDDEQDILNLYGDELTEAGFNVVTALDGAEGVKMAKKQKPDLILMDLKMPVMDGLAAFTKIHEDPKMKALKIVFLSAFGDPNVVTSDIKTAKDLGAAGFIKKGVDLKDFVRQVNEHLAE